MNHDSVLKLLAIKLSLIVYHAKILQDLTALIAGSGCEEKFFTTLLARLKFLLLQGTQATRHKEFEALKGEDGLFSMHISVRDLNVRILYAFSPQNTPILLLAFHERAGKRKTEYSAYTGPARERLKEKLEELQHG